MGTSRQTCLISNLPIIEGELARLIVLEKRPTRSESGVAPFFFPIKVKVDAYGSVEDVLDQEIGKVFQERVVTGVRLKKLPLTKRWDAVVEREEYRKRCVEGIEDSKDALNNVLCEEMVSSFYVAYIREDVFQKMLEISLANPRPRSRDVKNLVKAMSQPISQVKLEGIDFNKTIHNLWSFDYEVSPSVFNSPVWATVPSEIIHKALVEHLGFLNAMTVLRREFYPSNVGSQTKNWQAHIEFNEALLEISKKYSDDNEYDDD